MKITLTDDEILRLVGAMQKPVFVLNMAKPGLGLRGAETRRRNAINEIRAVLEAALAEHHEGADPAHGGLTRHSGARGNCPAPDCAGTPDRPQPTTSAASPDDED